MTTRNNHRRASNRPGSCFEPLEDRRLMSAGALDTSFAGTGKTTLNFGPGITVEARDIAVQSDGKTLVVGKSSTGDVALARFNMDGSPDSTFGPNHDGKVLKHVGYSDLPCGGEAVAIMPGTGSIIVAGTGRWDRPEYGFDHASMFLLRFNPDGSLPLYNAIEATKFDALFSAHAADLAIQSDGKVVVAGTYINDNDTDMFVARFNYNFAPDGSFGDDGVRILGFGGDDKATSVAIDYNGTPSTNPRYGSIVVAGTNVFSANAKPQFAVARVRSNGSTDSSFSGDGKATAYIGGVAAEASGLLVQPDDRIVLVGTATYTSPRLDNKFAMVRFATNGAVDTSFGTAGSGWVTTDLFGDDRASDVIRAYDGSSLLVGGSSNGKFAVVQYSNNGVIDRTFGTNGYVVTQFADDSAVARLAPGPGRRFVAAGGSQFHTARYLQAGANLVSAVSLDSSAAEQGLNPASFFVYRSERLPYPTRVFFAVGGTATRDVDYTGLIPTAGCQYVDIPANQTYTVVTITPIDDALLERPETATFTLMVDHAYELAAPSSVTLTIADNDRPILGPRPIMRLQSRLASSTTHRNQAPRNIFSDHLIDALI